MKSCFYVGETSHTRFSPVRRFFRYRLFWLGLDLSDLDRASAASWLLGVDRRGILSIATKDREGRPLRHRIQSCCQDIGIDVSEARVMMLAMPRVCGYSFNPVNFYLCQKGDSIISVVCEVRNTFGEVHYYTAAPQGHSGASFQFQFPKQFYVSPFLEDDGHYEMSVCVAQERCDVSISLIQRGSRVFHADLRGRAMPLATASLATALLLMPCSITLVMARIHWQAWWIRMRAGIIPHHKPTPSHPHTMAASRRSVWHWMRHRLISLASSRPTGKEPN